MTDTPFNISPEEREQVQKSYEKIAQYQQDHSGQQLHKLVLEECQILVKILPKDPTAVQMMLVSQIKLKQFDQACTFLNGTPQDIR